MRKFYFQVKTPFGASRLFLPAMIAILALAAMPAHAADNYRMRVVVFGDSVFSGHRLLPEETFASRLARRLQTQGYDVEVVDRSGPDDTTALALARIEQVVSLQPDLVIVELGMNDAMRGIDPKLIYNNLHSILYKLRYDAQGNSNGVYVVFAGVKAPPTAEYSYREQLKRSYDQLAEAHGLPFYPSVLDGVAGVPTLSLADGMHPNAEGINMIIDNMLPLIDATLRYRLEQLMKRSAAQYQNSAPQDY